MFSRPAISCSADATSSACARLSSWHGPATIEIGKSLPNLTGPTSTTSAAEMAVFNGLDPVCARPCRSLAFQSTQFNGFEYQGCAKGHFGRYHNIAVSLGSEDTAFRKYRQKPCLVAGDKPERGQPSAVRQ